MDLLQFKMRESQLCNVVCRLKLNAKTAKKFKEKIEDEYRVNMCGTFLFGSIIHLLISMRISLNVIF